MQKNIRILLYITALLPLNLLMANAAWGSAYLSIIIATTYLTFLPTRIFHPNNMLFAFSGLYVILSSTLNLILDIIDWEYVLPWGQQIYWSNISSYVLFQAEFTFLVLFFSFHYFSKAPNWKSVQPSQSYVAIRPGLLPALYILTFTLVLWFIQGTAGLEAWISDYSFTYLTKREGYGLLNVVVIAIGNIVVFLLGLKTYYAKNKLKLIFCALLIVIALSYIGGIKSRLIFLLMLFLSPYLMEMKFRPRVLIIFATSFFLLLYVGTLVRTEGFYASWPFFLEMLVGYFNVYQLHDYVVTSRDPGLLQTVFLIFTKPLQILGVMDANADFDISVMLTKEFFPEQWELEHATQQWPIDTELYLNYYGFYFSWLPLIAYAWLVSWLYRAAILRRNLVLVPIFVMEFQRIFSTMRGTIIPWETPIYIAQYLLIYVVCKFAIQSASMRRVVGRARMPDLDARAHVAQPTHALWYSIFQAIENERCLDLRYRATRTDLRDDDPVPNYKVMKQLALRNKLGILYRPFIALGLVLIPLLAVVQWLLALLIAVTRAGSVSGATLHIVPTMPANIGLIEAALYADPHLQGRSQDRDILSFVRLSREIGLRGVLFCIASHVRLLSHILRTDCRRRTDLLLHSRDALVLLMLARYAQWHPTHGFATDDHYQRWAFLLSHYCEDFRIVQHGFLDQGIQFPHAFGIAQTVYVRDLIFLPEFAAYYRVQQGTIFSPVRHLTPNPFSETGLFLASSFPSIDEEIDLVRRVKAQRDVPVIVKFHPAHSYDSRKQELAALASHVCFDDDLPTCKVFVSHNSFMEFDYKACGIPTFSMAHLGGPADTAQSILALLDQQQPQDYPSAPISITSFPRIA